MSNKFTEFNLPIDSYAAFDATSLKTLIKNRLTDKGIFTDQIFEGSNLSSMIDVISYSYHVLMFYMNKTSNESMFSQAQIYENMNRIVKILNYKPIGNRTSVLPFALTAGKELTRGIYTIPRYSFIDADGIKFSFNRDVTFAKSTDFSEPLTTVSEEVVLYQGQYVEYPRQIATGEPFETFTITLPRDINIDHSNIDLYILKNKTKKYVECDEVESLYFSNPEDLVYEKRYNENGRYEIKFGNNINGAQLDVGDQLYIMYLKSDGTSGKVAPNALDGKPLTLYTSVTFSKIQNDIRAENIRFVSLNDSPKLKFSNSVGSTDFETPEDVETIRQYATQFFKTQNRLVTSADFKTYIDRRFGNVLNDVQVVSNAEYVNGYMKYLDETLNLSRPSLESRALYNQIRYADSNNFNDVHLFVVPRVEIKTSATVQTNFLAPSQKELIRNGVNDSKLISAEVVFSDPVYMAVDFGVMLPKETISPSIGPKTKLVLERSPTAKKNADEIKQQAYMILNNYFKHANTKLGQELDISSISSQLISLNGVQRIYMTRTDAPTYRVNGLSLLVWNPVYEDKDINIINQNTILQYFKYPYMFDTASLLDKIQVTQAIS